MGLKLGFLLTGIAFIIAALILFVVDFIKNKDEREALKKMNDDAERLIEELNVVSSLILDEMDKRYSRMLEVYREFKQAGCWEQRETGEQVGEEFYETEQKEEGCTGEVSKKRQILKLYQEGLAAPEIAKKLNIGTGEVELIIKLVDRGVARNDKVF